MKHLAVLMAAAVLVVASGCTPSAKITADTDGAADCGTEITMGGSVTPADATPKVVLQRTVNGKWVDWKWHEGYTYSAPHIIEAKVDRWGSWYMDPRAPVAPVGGVFHLRVRSAGGTVVSNSMYVTIMGSPDGCPSSLF